MRFAVVCADINKAAAERAVDLISKIVGGAPKAISFVADVGKEADIVALVEKAVSEFGRLDVMLCVLAFQNSVAYWLLLTASAPATTLGSCTPRTTTRSTRRRRSGTSR